jgi:hypothetical protein
VNFYSNVSYFHEWIVTTIATNGGADWCDIDPVLPTVVASSRPNYALRDDAELVYNMLDDQQWLASGWNDWGSEWWSGGGYGTGAFGIEKMPSEWIFGVACATEAMQWGNTQSNVLVFGEIDIEQMDACGTCFDRAYDRESNMRCAEEYFSEIIFPHCNEQFMNTATTENETLPCMLNAVMDFFKDKSKGWRDDDNSLSTMSNLFEDMINFMKHVMSLEAMF